MSIVKGKIRLKTSDNAYTFILPETTVDQVYDDAGKTLPEILEELQYQKNIGIDQKILIEVTATATREVNIPMSNYKPELHIMNIIISDKLVAEDSYVISSDSTKVTFNNELVANTEVVFIFTYLKRNSSDQGQLVDGRDIVDNSIHDVKLVSISAGKVIESDVRTFVTKEERAKWNTAIPHIGTSAPTNNECVWYETVDAIPYTSPTVVETPPIEKVISARTRASISKELIATINKPEEPKEVVDVKELIQEPVETKITLVQAVEDVVRRVIPRRKGKRY